MLRFEITEGDRAMPPIVVDDAVVHVGSDAKRAKVCLPGAGVRGEHVMIGCAANKATWIANFDAIVDGVPRGPGDHGEVGERTVFEIGAYKIRVSIEPEGALASPAQRTASLARELVRSLLGGNANPAFDVERGPAVGSTRALAPPESTLVIGRGDEADWVILDEDLSRAHVEVRRGWDGVTIRDLDSKNGTRVDGVAVGEAGAELHDDARVELGNVTLWFRDPAERHLEGKRAARAALPPITPPVTPVSGGGTHVGRMVMLILAAAAIGCVIWILVS